jgi:hypothetical protein
MTVINFKVKGGGQECPPYTPLTLFLGMTTYPMGSQGARTVFGMTGINFKVKSGGQECPPYIAIWAGRLTLNSLATASGILREWRQDLCEPGFGGCTPAFL